MDGKQRGAEMQTGGWFWEYKVALKEPVDFPSSVQLLLYILFIPGFLWDPPRPLLVSRDKAAGVCGRLRYGVSGHRLADHITDK